MERLHQYSDDESVDSAETSTLPTLRVDEVYHTDGESQANDSDKDDGNDSDNADNVYADDNNDDDEADNHSNDNNNDNDDGSDNSNQQ